MPSIFICYAHKDQEFLDDLLEYLKPFEFQKQVEVWSDRKLEIGDRWDQEIKATLKQVQAAILLISQYFLASQYIRNKEIPVLLKDAQDRGVEILPIIVGRATLEHIKFKYPDPQKGPQELSLSVFQAANPPNQPLNSLEKHEQQEVFFKVTERLLKIIDTTSPAALETNLDPEPTNTVSPTNTDLYLERPLIESLCYRAIQQPGAVLRLKAPWRMGKTSLMNRILLRAKQENYLTVFVNFQDAEHEHLTNLDQFLRWFCDYIGKELQQEGMKLQLPTNLADYWHNSSGSKVSCKYYFKKTFLDKICYPLVIGLDNVEKIYANPQMTEDFFGLLRGWREQAQRNENWKKLRLMIAYSKVIPCGDIFLSPFNVGQVFELQEFEDSEILALAKDYKLNWQLAQVSQLMELVGGYPYLVKIALRSISDRIISLEELLETASTNAGIYHHDFQYYLRYLEKQPDLITALRKVLDTSDSVRLEFTQALELESMGLVKRQENDVIISCLLYQKYFQAHL